jgi:hypothetical protein
MVVKINSTRSKVVNLKKLQKTLARHHYEGVRFLVEDGFLHVTADGVNGNEEYGEDWPQALERAQLPSRKDYSDEVEWAEAKDRLLCDKGDDGLGVLLAALAPCLATTLVILAAGFEKRGCVSKAWIVDPATELVEAIWVNIG